MTTQEGRLAKIVKLKAQALHPNTGPKEAERYAMHAAKLMARHGIDQDMVDAVQGVDRDIVERLIPIDGPLRGARATMVSFIAAAVHCRTIVLYERHGARRQVNGVVVIGTPGDTERVAALFDLLWSQGELAMLSDLVASYDVGTADRIRTNWLNAFTRVVSWRLAEIERRQADEAQQEGRRWDPVARLYATGPSAELVLRAKDQRVDDYFAGKFGHLRKEDVTPPPSTALGVSGGVRAGARADIGLKGMRE